MPAQPEPWQMRETARRLLGLDDRDDGYWTTDQNGFGSQGDQDTERLANDVITLLDWLAEKEAEEK